MSGAAQVPGAAEVTAGVDRAPEPDAADVTDHGGMLRRLRDAAGACRRLWRTSLQVRVVIITLVIGSILTLALQSFLYGRIADGLVSSRKASAMEDAAAGARSVRGQLEATDRTDIDGIQRFAYDILGRQEAQSPEHIREIILARSIDNLNGPLGGRTFDTGISPDVIPEELRRAIAEDPTHQQVRIVTVPSQVSDDARKTVPAVVVGTQIQIPEAGPYELYYLFPMHSEERTMDVVWRVFLAGSVAIVATLGLLAFMVTRLVVEPLRQASEVAARLSGGHLNERMLVHGEDEIARLAAAFNDMAEHLQTQISQLEDLSRVQQRFVSDVSHELRTPLTTIHMASELIHEERGTFDPMVARSAELLHAQVERFESLLADLLEISRFDAGGAVLDLERVDLRDIVARTIAGAEQIAAARGSEIVVVGDAGPCTAAVDARRVERILRNLLVNAVEHGEGRPVTMELAASEDAVAVVVADEGIGLKSGEADLVFTRFWRADPSRQRTTGGTGLGLAISLEDAHLHHGRLEAWGESGRGARFRLTLPRSPERAPVEPPLPLEPPEPALATGAVESDEADDTPRQAAP